MTLVHIREMTLFSYYVNYRMNKFLSQILDVNVSRLPQTCDRNLQCVVEMVH